MNLKWYLKWNIPKNDLAEEAREKVVPNISKKFENEHNNEEDYVHFLNNIKYQIITCLVADGHREFLKSELH